MAQALVVFSEIGQIIDPKYNITPRMMSSMDEELGFVREDFIEARRGDMYVTTRPDGRPHRRSPDFFSADIQNDLFPESFALLESEDGDFINDEPIFLDEEMMHDPAYVQAWTEFVAEKGLEFADRRMEDAYFSGIVKAPTSQRHQEKVLVPADSERTKRSHGRRGRNHVPSISERVRHHNKVLNVLAPEE